MFFMHTPSHQHVFGKPALALPQDGTQSESEALLPEQGVSTVTAAIGTYLVSLWQVSYDCVLRVAWPVTVQGFCKHNVSSYTRHSLQNCYVQEIFLNKHQ